MAAADSDDVLGSGVHIDRAHLVLGAVLASAAFALAAWAGTGMGGVLLFGALPDVALLAAIGASHAPGQLPPRAVPLCNLLHSPAAPLALVLLAAVGILSTPGVVAGLGWGAHIAFDRGFGYGLRTVDGWQRAAH
jgi:hypothetical protein